MKVLLCEYNKENEKETLLKKKLRIVKNKLNALYEKVEILKDNLLVINNLYKNLKIVLKNYSIL